MGAIDEHKGRTEADFRAFLEDYIREQALPVDKFGHQPRLYALTRLTGEGQRYDDEVVFAAAWLHDLGVFIGHRPSDPAALAAWDSVCYAIEQAPALLRRSGFPAGKISAVVDAIATHQPQSHPSSIEGVILRDADILEQLGSIGILRAAAKVGRDTRYKTFAEVAKTLRNNLNNLPSKLQLPRAKALAAPRIALLEEFLRELETEAHGALG